jgi:hypothetical protein
MHDGEAGFAGIRHRLHHEIERRLASAREGSHLRLGHDPSIFEGENRNYFHKRPECRARAPDASRALQV